MGSGWVITGGTGGGERRGREDEECRQCVQCSPPTNDEEADWFVH